MRKCTHNRQSKRRCEITIISFSRSICSGELAALIGVTGNLIPAVFHAIVTLSGSLRSPPSPRGEGGPRQRRSGALVNGVLETIFPALFHTARTLSGSLRSPPSPRGEGFVSGIPLPPSNLRPFGAPPSIGRREYPREPLPLEGAVERSEAGLAFFFAAKPPPLCLPHWGRGTAPAVDRVLSLIVDLRRISSLFFIPLEPYPARSARHLPHAEKAVFRG